MRQSETSCGPSTNCDRGRRAGLRQGAQLPAGRKARFLTLARWAAAVLSLTLLAGCGLGETSSPAPSSAASPSAPSGPSAAPVGMPAGAADWPTYHGDAARSGILRD